MNIDRLLLEKNMTKAALADRIGIQRQNINALLNNPTEATIRRIANALEIPVARLFDNSITSGIEQNVMVCPKCGARLLLVAADD